MLRLLWTVLLLGLVFSCRSACSAPVDSGAVTALCIDDFVFHRCDFRGRVGVIPQVLNKTLILFLNARVDFFPRASVCVCACVRACVRRACVRACVCVCVWTLNY